MPLAKKQALQAAAKRLREERAFALKIERENLKHRFRQAQAASRIRSRILKQTLAAAGIDPEMISRQHEKRDKASKDLLTAQAEILSEHVKAVRQRQRAERRRATKDAKRLQSESPNPGQWLFLTKADRFTPSRPSRIHSRNSYTFQASAPTYESPELGINTFSYRIGAEAEARGWFGEHRFFDIAFAFDYDREDGIVNPVASLQPNGSYHVHEHGGCGTQPHAFVEVGARLYFGQYGPDDLMRGWWSEHISLVRGVASSPEGIYVAAGAPFSDEVALSLNRRYPIYSGYPAVCLVCIDSRIIVADDADAWLDLDSNVHSIFLDITYKP